jgi:hypothetical protein
MTHRGAGGWDNGLVDGWTNIVCMYSRMLGRGGSLGGGLRESMWVDDADYYRRRCCLSRLVVSVDGSLYRAGW